jgi:serine/threonine-protein kinase RsbW
MQSRADVQLALPATHRYLNIVGAVVAELLAREDGLAEPQVVSYNVQLALQEICANIVDHAYDGEGGRLEVAMSVVATPWRLVVELSDTGRSFDPSDAPEPDLEAPQEGGYGLFLARALMDEVSYAASAERNCWRLVKQLEGVSNAD